MMTFLCLAAVAVDGDTIRCADRFDEVNGRVRIARIDAPERGEAGFAQATAAMTELIADREVRCTIIDADPRESGFQERDRFDRPVARCSADGVDIGEALVRGGFAGRWP